MSKKSRKSSKIKEVSDPSQKVKIALFLIFGSFFVWAVLKIIALLEMIAYS